MAKFRDKIEGRFAIPLQELPGVIGAPTLAPQIMSTPQVGAAGSGVPGAGLNQPAMQRGTGVAQLGQQVIGGIQGVTDGVNHTAQQVLAGLAQGAEDYTAPFMALTAAQKRLSVTLAALQTKEAGEKKTVETLGAIAKSWVS